MSPARSSEASFSPPCHPAGASEASFPPRCHPAGAREARECRDLLSVPYGWRRRKDGRSRQPLRGCGMTRAAGLFALAATLAACNDSTPPEPEQPLELALELVVDGLTTPVLLTAPDNDARLFVVERIGRVRVIKDGALLETPFLDIRERVGTVFERGLLGMAFHPQYASNGRLYVYYIDRSDNVVLERFSSTPGSDVVGVSDGVVISFRHGGINLHGGTVAFGPDGMLYIASGDGGCCGDPENDAQNMTSLLGKMLRLDVSTHPYTVPPTNPFVGQQGIRPEIWASGLRNPWRFTFDHAPRFLYIADVGEASFEEVNVVPSTAAGLNYGWRLMEATACFNPSTNCAAGANLTLPALGYPRAEGCAVIGGYVYRGAVLRQLVGHYLYADHCAGWLRSFRWTGTGTTDHREWEEISIPGVTSFGRDGAGELYMIADTRVWKIVPR
jgi:glucose/arabinose dehydrogenase